MDISSTMKVESTLKLPQRTDVKISTWICLSKSMKFLRTFHVEIRWRIDGKPTKIFPLGSNQTNLRELF